MSLPRAPCSEFPPNNEEGISCNFHLIFKLLVSLFWLFSVILFFRSFARSFFFAHSFFLLLLLLLFSFFLPNSTISNISCAIFLRVEINDVVRVVAILFLFTSCLKFSFSFDSFSTEFFSSFNASI